MNEENIPIDIHYNKLLDWLINRRHCNNNWQAAALVVREKINDAIQDMPEHPTITALLGGTYINYFHCLKIIAILKETEAASKNIFGRYSSQRMKDWQQVVSLYEKDGVYLAEGAQLLTRNVNYEIPALKKQITRYQQLQKDCSRKEGECISNASELKQKYIKECKKMGIEGKKVKKELMSLVKNLPSTFNDIAESTQQLNKATEFYSNFVAFTLKSEFAENCCRLLKYVMCKGNTTTYEWRTGKVPTSIEENTLNYSLEEDDTNEQDGATEEIDFNIDDTAEIDFCDEPIEMPDEIDFGEIDFGDDIEIEVVDESLTEPTTAPISSVPQEVDNEVAAGLDALTVLDNPETRAVFINDLYELQSFLTQRLIEMKTDSDDILTAHIFQDAPTSLLIETPQVEDMKNRVTNIVNQLTSVKMQDLMLIRSSPRYVDRVDVKLKKICDDSEKLLSVSRLMVTRQTESVQEEQDTTPRLELIRSKMKELHKEMEQDISRKYKNRRVNIMGDINTV